MELKYYVRFITSEKYAKADAKRGWSMIAASDDLKYLQELNAENKYELVRHPFIPNYYALKIDGLCGYGPYDTIEEARKNALREMVEKFHDEPWKDKALPAIYTGYDTGWDEMAGDLFHPESFMEIVKIENYLIKGHLTR